MEFWNSLLTEQSWALLQELQKKPFKFVVIGGWAAYLWTHSHKSKDIDIILDNFKDLDYLKENYRLKKNDALKKYEIQFGEIDVDIYVAYYSQFPLPIAEIKKHTTVIEGINVVLPEILLILKQAAEYDQEHSVKGSKDRIDIVTLLLFSGVDLNRYMALLKKYGLEHYHSRLRSIVREFSDIRYLGLDLRQYVLRKKALLKTLSAEKK